MIRILRTCDRTGRVLFRRLELRIGSWNVRIPISVRVEDVRDAAHPWSVDLNQTPLTQSERASIPKRRQAMLAVERLAYFDPPGLQSDKWVERLHHGRFGHHTTAIRKAVEVLGLETVVRIYELKRKYLSDLSDILDDQ